MNNYINSTDTRIGTLNGTLLALLYSLNPSQLLTSAILAATGALVSFLVSVFCKWVWEKLKQDK